jgi:hypothetical protein
VGAPAPAEDCCAITEGGTTQQTANVQYRTNKGVMKTGRFMLV